MTTIGSDGGLAQLGLIFRKRRDYLKPAIVPGQLKFTAAAVAAKIEVPVVVRISPESRSVGPDLDLCEGSVTVVVEVGLGRSTAHARQTGRFGDILKPYRSVLTTVREADLGQDERRGVPSGPPQ